MKAKRLLLLTLLLLTCVTALRSQQVTFTVRTPGSLPTMIAESKKYTITNMKIVGEINSDDMLFICEMARNRTYFQELTINYNYKYNNIGNYKNGKLEILDISEASFVVGGNGYISQTVRTGPNTQSTKKLQLEPGVINYAQFACCNTLKKLILPDNLTEIRDGAFYDCSSLEEVIMPSYTTNLGHSLFYNTCLSDISLGKYAKSNYRLGDVFLDAKSLKRVNLDNENPNYKEVDGALYSADGDSLLLCPAGREGTFGIADGTKVITYQSFAGCGDLSSILFPASVEKVEKYAFAGGGYYPKQCQPAAIYCYGDIPPLCEERAFEDVIKNTTQTIIYVPRGCKTNYEYAMGWGDFMFIEEFSISPCPKPTISYANGELHFQCEAENAEYETVITDADVKTHHGSSVSLTGTYDISVYATAPGFDRSDAATATLCWIDLELKDEDGVHSIRENTPTALLLQCGGGKLTVTGAANGTIVGVYTVDGMKIGETEIVGEKAIIATNLRDGDIAIVKIGNKSIKIVWQE